MSQIPDEHVTFPVPVPVPPPLPAPVPVPVPPPLPAPVPAPVPVPVPPQLGSATHSRPKPAQTPPAQVPSGWHVPPQAITQR